MLLFNPFYICMFTRNVTGRPPKMVANSKGFFVQGNDVDKM